MKRKLLINILNKSKEIQILIEELIQLNESSRSKNVNNYIELTEKLLEDKQLPNSVRAFVEAIQTEIKETNKITPTQKEYLIKAATEFIGNI